jgi:serine/threonine protein kinase
MSTSSARPIHRVLAEQAASWDRREPVLADELVLRHPEELAGPAEQLEVIFNEFRLRHALGHGPDVAIYAARYPQFPQLRGVLSAWVESFEPDRPDLPPPSSDGAAAGDPGGGEGFPTIPGYHVEGRLDEGAMGTVYLAKSKAFPGHPVALKLLKDGAGITPEDYQRDYERMAQEAQNLRSFTHTHIVTVLACGRYEGRPYLVMEYVSGGTLAAAIGRLTPGGALTERERQRRQRAIAQLLALIARAAAHVLSKGLLHRDLKPDNILLQPAKQDSSAVEIGEGEWFCPKLGDFGLAEHLDPSGTRGRKGSRGHRPYLAPEVLAAPPGALVVRARTEVYSLGVILYQLLTGLPAKELRHPTREWPLSPWAHDKRLPPRLVAICEKCLSFDPKRRYDSLDELAEELEDFSRGGVGDHLHKLRQSQESMRATLRRAVVVFGALVLALAVLVFRTSLRSKPDAENTNSRPGTRPWGDPPTSKEIREGEDAEREYAAGRDLSEEKAYHSFRKRVSDRRKAPSRGGLDYLEVHYKRLLSRYSGRNKWCAGFRIQMGVAYDDYAARFEEGSPDWRRAKEQALGYYRQATEVCPSYAAGWNNLAATQVELGDATLVVENAQKAVDLTRGGDVNLLAARQDTLFQAYVAQARSRGKWLENDRAGARRVAGQLIDSLKSCKKRARAEAIEFVILPLLDEWEVPTPGYMKAIQQE